MSPRPGSHPADEPQRQEPSSPASHLLRLHRHSLTNVLVIGGTAARREQVARSFHRESPLRGGAFVAVDCAGEEPRLRAALERWTGASASAAQGDDLSGAEHGTLFLDSIEKLSPETQRLALALARRLLGEPGARSSGTPGRLVVGSPLPLSQPVSEGRFLEPLLDALDKVRVELEPEDPRKAT